MKKLLSLMLALSLSVVATACGGDSEETTDNPADSEVSDTDSTESTTDPIDVEIEEPETVEIEDPTIEIEIDGDADAEGDMTDEDLTDADDDPTDAMGVTDEETTEDADPAVN
jgi:ABC-type glycerol-3-phosphate transport system substrate-binding protein